MDQDTSKDQINEFLKEAFQNAKRKHLKETFDYLKYINSPQDFIISSSFPTIDKVAIHIDKGKRCFDFSTDSINIVKDFQNYNRIGWGFNSPIGLNTTNNNESWEIPEKVANVVLHLGKDMKTSGKIWHIESYFDSQTEAKYFRLVLPLSQKDTEKKSYSEFIQNERFVLGETVRMGGLTEFFCNLNKFHLFNYSLDKEHFLFIDSLSPIKHSEFEESISAIIYSLGFISGFIPRNEMYVLQSDNNDFLKIRGFHYKRMEDTVYSNMNIITPRELAIALKLNYQDVLINTEVFSTIVTKAKADPRFLRCLIIISEGNNYSPAIRASCYSVALETIKNIIIEDNENKVNPFKSKKMAKEVIEELKKNLSSFGDTYFNNKLAIIRKIEQLNQVTNWDSFKIAFELCEVRLTTNDEDILLKRNEFLHGKIPFEDEVEIDHKLELQFITYKLHFLVSILIIKYCGFKGFVLNTVKYLSLQTKSSRIIEEPLLRT